MKFGVAYIYMRVFMRVLISLKKPPLQYYVSVVFHSINNEILAKLSVLLMLTIAYQ